MLWWFWYHDTLYFESILCSFFPFLLHYFGVLNCVSTFCSQQNPNVERQHAIIEYDEAQGCFVVQDLNSAHGTYINDCRVQNAAVRLAPGDVVRFGYRIL